MRPIHWWLLTIVFLAVWLALTLAGAAVPWLCVPYAAAIVTAGLAAWGRA